MFVIHAIRALIADFSSLYVRIHAWLDLVWFGSARIVHFVVPHYMGGRQYCLTKLNIGAINVYDEVEFWEIRLDLKLLMVYSSDPDSCDGGFNRGASVWQKIDMRLLVSW